MPHDLVDLRSDTLTRPTAEMRRAMADAEVGDDGYGEDPTVRRLEERYAALVGKAAGLFLPSGTMANQVAMRAQAPAGTVVLAGRSSHIASFEHAATGLASFQLVTLDDLSGAIDPDAVAFHVAAADHHWTRPSLVCVEQTHMASGGRVLPDEVLDRVAVSGLPVHMDGARLLNAAVATARPPAVLASWATTVWTALTKGLCAPVGSVLAGPHDVIGEARHWRRRLGGQLRQAGVLAAAGLVALDSMVDRLADDHRRARELAVAVADRWPDAVDPAAVDTNIVVFTHADPATALGHLRAAGILAGTVGPGRVRLVTHHDVDDADIARATAALRVAP